MGKETDDDKKTRDPREEFSSLLLGPKKGERRQKKKFSNSTRKRPVAKTRAAQQPRIRTPRYPFEPSVPIPRAFRPIALHKRAQTREKPSAFFSPLCKKIHPRDATILKCTTRTPREKKTREYSNSFHRNAREARKNHPPRKRVRSRERKTYLCACFYSLDKFFL